MLGSRLRLWCAIVALVSACGSEDGDASTGTKDGGTGGIAGAAGASAGAAGVAAGAGGAFDASDADPPDTVTDASEAGSTACTGDTLFANRNRLLASYFQFLKTFATTPQTNGLSGSNVASALEIWQKLDPSSRAVFLTLTARMQGSLLGKDGSSMLSHVTKLYRVVGGEGATATNEGSCGGGEYNRMIVSMDAPLQAALLAANDHQGALQSNGKRDIADVVPASYWRESHDLAGPHDPFDRSDETEGDVPRGQTQYFANPGSTAANAPLGRQDLSTLVDPYALEIDHDYDCVHDSNPLCTYFAYGPVCLTANPLDGTELYVASYGDYTPGFTPLGCD